MTLTRGRFIQTVKNQCTRTQRVPLRAKQGFVKGMNTENAGQELQDLSGNLFDKWVCRLGGVAVSKRRVAIDNTLLQTNWLRSWYHGGPFHTASPRRPTMNRTVLLISRIVNSFTKSVTNGSGPVPTERQLATNLRSVPGWRPCRPAIFSAATAFAIVWAGHLSAQAEETPSQTLVVRFDQSLGPVKPRVGFLGGLRDSLPDDLIQPLKPSLWRIGHQFRGRIAGDLTGAVERVERLDATYKLVMSDLIDSHPKDWAKYEADVQKLVAKVKPHAGTIIWEPVNEPDISHKPIEQYFEHSLHGRGPCGDGSVTPPFYLPRFS